MSPEFQNLYYWKSKPIFTFHLLVQILNMDLLKSPVTTYNNCHTLCNHVLGECRIRRHELEWNHTVKGPASTTDKLTCGFYIITTSTTLHKIINSLTRISFYSHIKSKYQCFIKGTNGVFFWSRHESKSKLYLTFSIEFITPWTVQASKGGIKLRSLGVLLIPNPLMSIYYWG